MHRFSSLATLVVCLLACLCTGQLSAQTFTGDVTLSSNADIQAFVDGNNDRYTTVDGNLTLNGGVPMAGGAISDLNNIKDLIEVTGTISILGWTNDNQGFVSWDNLTTIGGDLIVRDASGSLSQVKMESVTSIGGGVEVTNSVGNGQWQVSLNNLDGTIDRLILTDNIDASRTGGLKDVKFFNLDQITGPFTVTNTFLSNNLQLGDLNVSGALTVSNNPELTQLSLNNLNTISGDFLVERNAKLREITCFQITSTKNVTIQDSQPELNVINFKGKTNSTITGNLTVTNNDRPSGSRPFFNFDGIEFITGNVAFTNQSKVAAQIEMQKLFSVGGNMLFNNIARSIRLARNDPSSNLTGTLTLTDNPFEAGQEINFRTQTGATTFANNTHTSATGLKFTCQTCGDITISGNNNLGSIFMQNTQTVGNYVLADNPELAVIQFPDILNFGSFRLSGNHPLFRDLNVNSNNNNVQTLGVNIAGDLSITSPGTGFTGASDALKLFLVRNIGGDLILENATPNNPFNVFFNSLSLVGGDISIKNFARNDIQLGNSGVLDFNGNITLEGNEMASRAIIRANSANSISITSPNALGNNLATVEFPELTSVTNGITLNNNAALTTLKIPKLATVGGPFTLSGNTALATVDVPSDGVTTGGLVLTDNSNLTGGLDLEEFTLSSGDLTISGNTNFSACCSIDCDLQATINDNGGSVTVFNNAAGCASIVDIAETCETAEVVCGDVSVNLSDGDGTTITVEATSLEDQNGPLLTECLGDDLVYSFDAAGTQTSRDFSCADAGANGVNVTLYVRGPAGTAALASCATTVVVTDDVLPVITLNGMAMMDVPLNQPYTDAGATVADNCTSGLTATTAGSVDVTTPGTYTLTFTATDDANNAATPVEREVTVLGAALSTDAATVGTDFGTVNRMSADPRPVKTYTITNSGNVAGNNLMVTSSSSDFTVSNVSASMIGENGTVTFDVTFDPATANGKTGTVTVGTDDGAEATFNVSGNGGEVRVYLEETGQYYSSVQDAIDAATEATTIYIPADMYDEDLDFTGKQLTIIIGTFQQGI
ncbi:immunoglobulin-like domain-containing protein [Lewinella sp. 4G2]|uniref:immunoglobulin-like domain-containing protein n=1 Tax=Lewinella sp. 4G2 TaxID=1803372 RepID=UPI0007B4A8BA|nr:immunoglobulin-like domain-containing protein [Lewinella sp. 4G2]OAV43255.1 hypothetical protein A3850_001525 [Lewinella sp. 4G2]